MTTGEVRKYTSNTEKALIQVAAGTCYFPGCSKKIIEEIDGEPIVALEIVQIRNAKPGTARFEKDMADKAQAAFANLILLCTSHHKLVDRLRPEGYPIAVLEAWKQENEAHRGFEALRTVTESNLEEQLSRAFKSAGPNRDVQVEIAAGIMLPINSYSVPFEHLAETLRANSQVKKNALTVCVTVRNTATIDTWLEEISVHFMLGEFDTLVRSPAIAYSGRNDFASLNPQVPCRIPSGESVVWMMKHGSFLEFGEAAAAQGQSVSGFYAAARLGSGESEESTAVDWTYAEVSAV